jgi:hypothetical protein
MYDFMFYLYWCTISSSVTEVQIKFYHSAMSEIFAAVKIQVDVFWVVTSCGFVVGNCSETANRA